jgi:uncharacterized membrane protein YdbT with pleckstrin-like domain
VRRHPIVLVRQGVVFVGWLILLLVVQDSLPTAGLLRGLLGAAVVVLFVRTVWKVTQWHAEQFIVTDARILLVSGPLSRRVAMLPLRKVTDMSYRRSTFGRLLGYGEFVMESAGERQSLQRIRFLPHPDTLYLQISGLLFDPVPLSTADEY